MKEPKVEWLLDCEPRPVQIEATRRSFYGYRKLDHINDEGVLRPLPWAGHPAPGFAQFLQMRLGKTPLTLNEFMLFKLHFGVNKGLIFSPNSFKQGWAEEAPRFGVDAPVHVFDSKKRDEADWFMRRHSEGIVVVNYEALNSDANLGLLEGWVDSKTYMPADESVKIKNPQSQMFKKAFALSKDAAVTRALTGLPNPQGVTDFWSQLRFTRRLSGTNFYAFRGKFAKLGGFKNKKIIGVKNPEEFETMLDTVSFRADRRSWGMKIDSDYEMVNLDMTPAQKRVYDQMDKDFVAWLENGEMISADQVITKRMKMQQISSGFVYNEHGEAQPIMDFIKTPKWLDLKDRLDNMIAGKVIIIAHYRPTMEALFKALQPYGVAVIAGNADMAKMGRDVQEEKRRFNESPNCRVMLGQADAIKYGHTLMGTPDDPCLTMGFFENSYNLDTRAQDEERPQGHGQQGAIHIFDYASSKIEKEVVRALQNKENIANTILGYYKG